MRLGLKLMQVEKDLCLAVECARLNFSVSRIMMRFWTLMIEVAVVVVREVV